MESQKVQVDAALCQGCGVCIQVCPVEAIILIDDRAQIDQGTCTGCEACIDTCPEGAIQPVVPRELISAPQRPPAPAARQPTALERTAGTAVILTGMGLLARAARVLARTVGRWLTQPSPGTRSSAGRRSTAGNGSSQAGRAGGGGRRARRRRRGGS